jgi:hypothetical protein
MNTSSFYFGVLHPVARTLSRLPEEPSIATTLQGVYFTILYILPLHVSALSGYLQAEYTIILGSYFTHNGSVVLCCLVLLIVYVWLLLPLSF